MKISIIVPAYNAEKKIDRCMDSLINQTYGDIEIVVVNDGSQDNTLAKLKDYELKDQRIKVINKKNEGVSAARNDGIKASSGDYLLFVDSDDYISKDTVKILMSFVTNGQDGVAFGYSLIGVGNWGTDTHVLQKIVREEGKNVSALSIVKHVLTINPEEELMGYSVRYLYKKQILDDHKIYFDTKLKISEDYKFIVEFLMHANEIYVSDMELYIYDVNTSSSTSRYMPTLIADMNTVNQWLVDNLYTVDNQISKEHKGCIANTYLNHVQNIAKKDSGYSVINGIKNIYQVKKEHKYQEAINYTVHNLKSRKKATFAFKLFSINCDFVYFVLFYIRRRIG